MESPPATSSPAPADLQPEPPWSAGLAAGLLVVLCLVVYIACLAPSVCGGDSGELITAAWDFGVAHPPGYPLYTLLASLFCRMPFAEIAWRVNLLSALCDALAAGLLCLLVARATQRSAAGFVAGGLWAFCELIFRYAVCAEVFALNNLFVILLAWLAFSYWQKPRTSLALWGAFVFGLGLSNHHTLLFVGLPMVAMVLWRGGRALLRPKIMAALVGVGLLGLSPYLQLPVAASQKPLHSWGDASTLEGFSTHFLRKEYGTFRLTAEKDTQASPISAWLQYFERLSADLQWAGLGVLLLGLWVCIRRPSKHAPFIWLAATAWIYLLVFQSLANIEINPGKVGYGVFTRFWQLPHVLLFALFGFGFAQLQRWLPGKAGAAWLLAVVLVGLQLGVHVPPVAASGNLLFRDYARSLLEPLPEDAVYLATGDVKSGTLRYVQGCLQVRDDVRVLLHPLLQASWYNALARHHFPELVFPGERYGGPGYSLLQLLRANPGTSFFCSPLHKHPDISWKQGYEQVPWGMVYRLQPLGDSLDIPAQLQAAGAILAHDALGRLEAPPRGTWERAIWNEYWIAVRTNGSYLLREGMLRDNRRDMLEMAARLYDLLLEVIPRPQYQSLKNAGIVYHTLQRSEADLAKRDRVWRLFLERAPADDPFRPKARQVLELE